MSDKTFDIPAMAQSVDPAIRNPYTRMREAIQTLIGARGDGSQSIAALAGNGGSGSGGGGIIGLPGGGTGSSSTPDLTPPPTVTGLAAVAGFTEVIVTWDAALYTQGHGNAQTNIYAVKRTPGSLPLPTFSDAQIVYAATNALTIAALPSELNTRWHIWAKWQTVDGVESVAPAGGVNGVIVTTGQDIAQLLNVLTGQLTESQLYAELGARINLIDGSSSVPGTVNYRLATTAADLTSAFSSGDSTTYANAQTYVQGYAYSKATVDGSFTSQYNALTANYQSADASTLTSAQAFVTTYAYAKTTVDGALTSLSNTLTANYQAADGAVLSNAQSYVATYAYAKSAVDGALSGLSTTLTASYGAADAVTLAAAQAYTYSRADITGAISTAVSTVQASIESRPNLLPNGGFENGLQHWNVGMPGGVANTFSTGDGVWGRLAISNSMPDGIGLLQSDMFPIQGNAEYTITGDSGFLAASGYCYFDLLFYDASNNLLLDGPQNPINVPHDFSADGSQRAIHAVSVVAPSAAVNAAARYVWGLTSATAVYCRMIKVERGGLPATQYTAEGATNVIAASVQTEATARANADGTLFAQYTVKLDVNGYVSGYGLASTSSGAAPTSSFVIRADSFAIASPSGPGISPTAPFFVQTTPTTINGVAVPVGIYMTDAYILNGSITRLKIGTEAVDDSKIANLSAAKLTVGDGTVGGNLKSANYVGGSTGWILRPDGYSEFGFEYIRGTLLAYQIGAYSITAEKVNGYNLTIFGGAYTGYAWPAAGAGGGFFLGAPGLLLGSASDGKYFQVTSDGNVYAPGFSIVGGAATFSGGLNSVSGTFGNLSINPGGSIRAGQTGYNTGVGFWLGMSGSTPLFSIGNPAGSNIRWDGSNLYVNNAAFDSLSAAISGGNLTVYCPGGYSSYGTRSVVATGGRAPYSYRWLASLSSGGFSDGITSQVLLSSGTATTTVTGVGSSTTTTGSIVCFVTDANGRTTSASFYLSATHSAYEGGSGGGGGPGGE